MIPLTRGEIISSLRPGIHAMAGLDDRTRSAQFSQIFTIQKSSMERERDVQMYGLGMAAVRPESTPTQFDSIGEAWVYDYVHVPYSLGSSISMEAMDDNLYMSLADKVTKELAKGLMFAKETVHANILNRAFNASYTYGDGVQLVATTNKLAGGGTFSNKLSVDAALSEDALEQLLILISKAVNHRGIPMPLKAQKLVIPPELNFIASRILGSDYQVQTANNDINVIKSGNYLPGGFIINNYMSSSTNYFILTDAPQGLQSFERVEPKVTVDEDFLTDGIRIKIYERFSCGATNKYAIYGSQGSN